MGCGADPGDSTQAPKDVQLAKSALPHSATPDTSQVLALGADNAAFAFDLYRGIAAANAGKNLVFSPYSVSTALGMIYEGARGTTESELRASLHFELDKPALHQAFNATALSLASRGAGKTGADGSAFRLHMNNSIWAQRGSSPVPAFLDVMAVNYDAGLFLANFSGDPDGSRQAINAWVSDKTEQLIPELLQPGVVDARTRFVLTNTVYFNGGWQQRFDEAATHDAPFTKLDGSTVSSKLMSTLLTLPYTRGENYRAVALPYEDDALSFVAVLPDEDAFEAVEASWRDLSFATHEPPWSPTRIALSLPRLDYKQRSALNAPLRDLGIQAAFTDAADFSGMTNEKVWITAVVHEAAIKVREGGTIAAAATAVLVAGHDAVEAAPPAVRFDRPFLYAIVDQPTGALIFLGRVVDPTSE